MSIIENSKSSISQNNYSNQSLTYITGLRIFQIGVLFLAAAPVISFLLLIISSVLGSVNRQNNFFKDKYNYPFLIVSALMIVNCIFITFNYEDRYLVELSTLWVGLSNWIPFFWCFWGFQPFLKNPKLRLKTSILFFNAG